MFSKILAPDVLTVFSTQGKSGGAMLSQDVSGNGLVQHSPRVQIEQARHQNFPSGKRFFHASTAVRPVWWKNLAAVMVA